jgi:hypothetical protein
MGSVVSVVVAAVVAAGLALGTAFGIVTSQSATPEPVDKPLIVYGER